MTCKKRIVFTGGPSGGKTSIIEVVQRHFGQRVAVVPEAATILYGGGFPRKPGPDAMRCTQRAIYYAVRELEALSDLSGDALVSVCDRGTLDGLAYWPKTGESFLESVGSTLEKEYARYGAVIHLRSPMNPEVYQKSGTRIETHAQAVELDKKIEKVWEGHPRRFIIEDEPDFLLKVTRTMEILEAEIKQSV